MTKNPAKKVTNISADDSKLQQYLLVSSHKWHFLKFRKSQKIVSKSETSLYTVSNKNPTSLDSFHCFRTKKPSKIKDSRGSVQNFKNIELVYVNGLRKKQDTPKVAYFMLETSRPERSQ